MAVELGGRDAGDVGDVVVIGQRLAGEGFAAEDPPPAFNQIEPRRANGKEGVGDAWGGPPVTSCGGRAYGSDVTSPSLLLVIM